MNINGATRKGRTVTNAGEIHLITSPNLTCVLPAG
jgi:hypothetical protein